MARDGAGLYLRNGYWAFRYKDGSGKWCEKSTGKRKERDAWRAKDQFLTDLENGNLPGDMAEWTLSAAAEHWCEWRLATASPKTASVESRLLRQVKRVLGDDRLLKTLHPHDVEQYQAVRRHSVGPRDGEPGSVLPARNLEEGEPMGTLPRPLSSAESAEDQHRPGPN